MLLQVDWLDIDRLFDVLHGVLALRVDTCTHTADGALIRALQRKCPMLERLELLRPGGVGAQATTAIAAALAARCWPQLLQADVGATGKHVDQLGAAVLERIRRNPLDAIAANVFPGQRSSRPNDDPERAFRTLAPITKRALLHAGIPLGDVAVDAAGNPLPQSVVTWLALAAWGTHARRGQETADYADQLGSCTRTVTVRGYRPHRGLVMAVVLRTMPYRNLKHLYVYDAGMATRAY